MNAPSLRPSLRLALASLALTAFGQPALSAEPLVDAAWVVANVGKPGIVFIDLQPANDYALAHVPGAIHSNYAKDGWRVERASDKVPDMLPDNLEPLVATIGSKFGVDNATHVVLVAPGNTSTDMGNATRVYWTFKVLGHDNVSILNGGMSSYSDNEKNPLQQGIIKATPKTFKASVRKDMIITMADVNKARAAGVTLVDHRPEEQHVGISKHPKATVPGTIQGAKNLSHSWTTVNGGGVFRSKAQLEALYRYAGVPTTGEQIAFCNTGHWASVGWFVSSELVGNKQVKLYDGSMVEYTMLKGGPVEQKVNLPV
jgi:thiosulfate/3-mercaptopyruvate sulfurtransferase